MDHERRRGGLRRLAVLIGRELERAEAALRHIREVVLEEFVEGDDGAPKLCKVRVYRKDWARPAVGVAYWNEYVQTTRDKQTGKTRPNAMWSKMPHTMLAKCAESLAIRKATKSGEQVTLVQCTLTSILAAVQLGDLAIARKSIQAAAMLTRRLGERVLLGQWLTIAQAELATLDGHTEEGIALARLASEQASRLDQPHCVGVAECVLARALAARQPADSAEIDAHMHRSVTTLDAAGLTLEVARTRLHWALLLKRRQPEEPQRANELYNAALTRFRLSDCTQAIAEAERLWSASPAQPAEL